jgi:hypothetical protein
VTILFALAAGLCNALNVVTQHIASTAAPSRRMRGRRFVLYLFRSPMWLFGWVALGGAFVFQALALHQGQLSVVQPLLVSELVFALVLRRIWIHQSIRGVTWSAAGLTAVGLTLFLVAAEPQGGHDRPTAAAWVTATGVTGALVAMTALAGMRGTPARRAALLGSATAALWALVATFLKTTTDSFAQYGPGGAFTHWPVYALAASGLAAEVLNQVALHVGPLSVSQPFLVIVDPLVSIVLSVWVFGEQFTPNSAAIVLGALSFTGMCVGVALLTRTAPRTMEPTTPG